MRQVIILLAVAAANTGITQRVVEPMLPELARQFDASVPATASIITAFAFAAAGAQYFHGSFGDRFGKLRIVTWLTALSAIASLGCAMAGTLQSLLVWRFLAGIFASGAMTLGMAYLADVVPGDRRQLVLARFLSGSISGQALGPFVGGLLTDVIGWRSTFVFLGVVFSAVAVILFAQTRSMWNDGPRSEVSLLSPARYVELLSQRRTRGVLAFVFLEMMFFFGAFSFVGAMMKARFDVSFTLIGLVLAGYGLGGLLYSAAVHWLLLHFGQRGCVLLGGALGGLFYLGVAVAPAWPLVLVCTVGLGFGFYTVHNTLQTKGTDMAPHARAAGMALFSMMWAGGQAAGVSLMSAGVFAFGYAPMIAACGIAFALLALALRRELDQL